jgi:hypothetical protein
MEWLTDKFNDVLADLKRAHTSLTIWINGIVLAVLQALPYAQDVFHQLKEYVSPEFYKQAMVVLLVANLALRFKTKSALKSK